MTKIGVKIGRLLHKIRENRLACVIKPYMASKPHEEPRADKLRGNLESYHPNIDAWLRWVAIWVRTAGSTDPEARLGWSSFCARTPNPTLRHL